MPVLLALVLLVASSPALAQTPAPAPPGPYVVDIHGVLSGLPGQVAVVPPLSPTTLVPSRGSGVAVGAHVYAGQAGPARVGFGLAVLAVGRAVGADATRTRLRSLAPQLSLNFGTRDGWSYLSGGVGVSRVDSESSGATREISGVRTVNAGGGARWFLNQHVAVGFDLRLHRLLRKGSLMPTSLFAAGAGIALR